MRIALATLVLLGLALSPLPSTRAAEPANEPIENFTLQDPQGGQHSLADYSDKSVVVAFLGVECPLAKLYGPRLADLAESFPGVAFLGINSNTQDSITELAAYARVHKLNFPLLKDPGNRVADLFGAERTPEVFVLDAARRVRYRGRIDDQYDVGQARDKPTINDLIGSIKIMLDAYGDGKIDRLFLVHNEFVNSMTQKPVALQLLPASGIEGNDEHLQAHWDYIYEPDAGELLDDVLMRYIESQVYRGAVENFACEMAA